VADFCEPSNEPSVTINRGEFLDQLREYLLLKKNFVPLSQWTQDESDIVTPM
jgi:hypothetical protein